MICSAFVSLMEIHGGFEFECRMERRSRRRRLSPRLISVTRQTFSPALDCRAYLGGKFGATMPRAIVRLVLRRGRGGHSRRADSRCAKEEGRLPTHFRGGKKPPRKLVVGVVGFRQYGRPRFSIPFQKVSETSMPTCKQQDNNRDFNSSYRYRLGCENSPPRQKRAKSRD